MPDLVEVRRQQRRYYALLSGARRGIKQPEPIAMVSSYGIIMRAMMYHN